MDEQKKEISHETAVASELFAQLPAASRDAIIALIESLLSER